MKRARLFAIPDIHGRLDLLKDLLRSLHEHESLDLTRDKLIFLGDMVDRGRDSKGVLELVRYYTKQYPENVVALAGNHEYLMLDGLRSGVFRDHQLWMMNGGNQTLDSFGNRKVPEELLDWVASLPLSHEEPGFFFSHAPVPREEDRKVEFQGQPFTKTELIWTYESPEWMYARNFKQDDGKEVVGVCGHIHGLPASKAQPRFYPHYIFADAGCGCWYQAPLVAIEVRTRAVVHAWPAEAMVSQHGVAQL